MATAQPEPLLDVRFEHPEGIVWHEAEQRLYWTDIAQRLICSSRADGSDFIALETGHEVSAVAPRAGGGLVCAVRDGFALLSPAGELVPSAPLLETADLRMNEGGVDPAGRFWAGSMTLDESSSRRGTLYRLDPDGSISEHVHEVGISNGIGWSPDGQRCYYVDSLAKAADQFTFDLERGQLSSRRRFATFQDALPDGLAVDLDGCVWIALWGGSRIERFDPDGKLDRDVTLPGTQVATCTFGGPALGTLYIAVSQQDLNEHSRKHQQAGLIFAVDVGVAGLPFVPFAG